MPTKTDAYAGSTSAQTAGAVFKHLLLPIDFSESNIAAARYARQIASWGYSHVTLLNVRPAGTESDHMPIQGTDMLDRLKGILDRASVQAVMTLGDPANAISQYAADNGVDLIVMPTRGVGAVRRFVLGSVTAKVLQNSTCSVLTLVAEDSRPEDAEPHFHRIACAVDLGPNSLRIMHSADIIAKQSAAAATILDVSPQP
jgi:nucleotide-binding universal stress UspA family protein